MHRSYQFALIGAGDRGSGWMRFIEKNIDTFHAQCIAVADIRDPWPKELERFGKRFYKDYHELLANEKLNFVIVATQEAQHVDAALSALSKGIPVYLEKAVSHTWQGAVRLYQEVIKHSYPLFIGYNLRRFPAAIATANILKENKIGRIQSVLGHINTGNDFGSSIFLRAYYAKDADLSGDIVLSKLTHDTDFVQYVLNTEAQVCTAIATHNVWVANPDIVLNQRARKGIEKFVQTPSSHDVCCVTGLFKNSTAFTFLFTTTGPDYERRYVFNGTAGQLDTILHTYRPDSPLASVTLWLYGEKPQKMEIPAAINDLHFGGDTGVIADFFQWLATNPQKPHDPESILTGMIIPIAALESSRTGRHIDCAAYLAEARNSF